MVKKIDLFILRTIACVFGYFSAVFFGGLLLLTIQNEIVAIIMVLIFLCLVLLAMGGAYSAIYLLTNAIDPKVSGAFTAKLALFDLFYPFISPLYLIGFYYIHFQAKRTGYHLEMTTSESSGFADFCRVSLFHGTRFWLAHLHLI